MAEYQAVQTLSISCPSLDCPAPAKVVRDGHRGGQQRYECKGCGNNFFAAGKALRKQFTADQIAHAVDAYYSGLSYKQVGENMEDVFDVPEPSKSTVHAWVKAYTGLAQRYLDGKVGEDGTPATATGKKIRANVGEHWVADELVLRVGGKKMWCWNVMDRDTRYVLAVHLSPTRDTNDAIVVMEKAKDNAAGLPKTVTTDGLGSYTDAIRAVFPIGTKHVVSEGIYESVNNNLSERLQGSFRQRTKTQRGLQARRTGQEYLDGWVLDYNFFKDHEAHKGGTPAEAAGVAERVPWDSWEHITRIGGEVAEVEIKEHTPTPKKPGRKPKMGSVKEAVGKHLEWKEIQEARARRKGKKAPVVAGYPKKKTGKGGGPGGPGGRGKKEIGAATKK